MTAQERHKTDRRQEKENKNIVVKTYNKTFKPYKDDNKR